MSVHRYFLSLGSNLGNRETNLWRAIDAIAALPETAVVRLSSVYETDPVGFVDQPQFLNAVLEVTSRRAPLALMRSLLEIEVNMGRVRTVRFGPRMIDLDVLLCDDSIIEIVPELIVPHPRMHERAFVLVPLAELAPTVVHPVLHRTVEELCRQVGGREGVHWYQTHFPNASAPIES